MPCLVAFTFSTQKTKSLCNLLYLWNSFIPGLARQTMFIPYSVKKRWSLCFCERSMSSRNFWGVDFSDLCLKRICYLRRWSPEGWNLRRRSSWLAFLISQVFKLILMLGSSYHLLFLWRRSSNCSISSPICTISKFLCLPGNVVWQFISEGNVPCAFWKSSTWSFFSNLSG